MEDWGEETKPRKALNWSVAETESFRARWRYVVERRAFSIFFVDFLFSGSKKLPAFLLEKSCFLAARSLLRLSFSLRATRACVRPQSPRPLHVCFLADERTKKKTKKNEKQFLLLPQKRERANGKEKRKRVLKVEEEEEREEEGAPLLRLLRPNSLSLFLSFSLNLRPQPPSEQQRRPQ
jgi:hypothetical protein